MAIQQRRGSYANFDKSKLIPGEPAVVLSGDPNATDGKAAYIAFGSGDVKRLATDEDLAGKVDKVQGKGLSTNDYTTEEKNKLNGIEEQANRTIVDSELSDSSTNPVQNKVVNAKTTDIEHDLTIGDLAFSKVSIPVVRPSDWLEKGVNTATGELNNSNLVRVTRFFPIDDTCDYKFTGVIKKEGESENRVRFNYFYDKDKEFIGRSVSTIVENAKFVRFGYGFNSVSGITVDDYGFENLIADWSAEFTPSYIKKENETAEKLQVLNDDKADVIISTASGSIAHFEDGAEADAVSVIAHIEPVQDLNGYDHPWVGGSGRNKLENNCADATFTAAGGTVTATVNPDGSITINSDVTRTVVIYGNIQTGFVGTSAGQNDGKKHLANGTYKVSPLPSGISIQVYGTSAESGTGDLHRISVSSSGEFTIDDTYAYNYCRLAVGALVTDQVVYPMIRLASDTDDTYEPYENICPITGHTEMDVVVSPTTDAQDGTTYPIAFPSEAGTVYGGYVDAVRGKLVVDRVEVDLGTLTWSKIIDNVFGTKDLVGQAKEPSTYNDIPNIMCSHYISDSYANLWSEAKNKTVTIIWATSNSHGALWMRDSAYTDAATFKTAMNGVQLVYELATPIEYDITPQQITTLLGTNNIWHDANGETEVEYRADTKLYIEQLTKPTEDDMTANANIASGKFFMVGNRLFLSTSAIASGDTINPGTNCTELSLADALNNLN